jgi:hypothetical protein
VQIAATSEIQLELAQLVARIKPESKKYLNGSLVEVVSFGEDPLSCSVSASRRTAVLLRIYEPPAGSVVTAELHLRGVFSREIVFEKRDSFVADLFENRSRPQIVGVHPGKGQQRRFPAPRCGMIAARFLAADPLPNQRQLL